MVAPVRLVQVLYLAQEIVVQLRECGVSMNGDLYKIASQDSMSLSVKLLEKLNALHK